MTVFNPSSTIQSDSVTGTPTAQLSTNGAAHVTVVSGSSASTRATAIANAGISANLNSQVAPQPGLTLMGIAIRSASGAVAGVIVAGATAASGAALIPFRVANNASASVWLGPDGIAADAGISVLVSAGTLDVVTFYRVAP